jgi:hypothetical protein
LITHCGNSSGAFEVHG